MFVTYQKKTYGKEVMRTPSLKRKADSKDINDEVSDADFNLSQTQPTFRQPRILSQ